MFFALTVSLISALPAPLQTLQKNFKSVKSFEVNFEQEVRQDLFPETPERAVGRLMYSRPHSMEWTYQKPRFRRIEFNGRELTIEEQGEKQVIQDQGRLTLEKAFAFLWGEPDPSIFKIDAKSKTSFLIKPRDPDSVSFEWIEVSILSDRVNLVRVKDRLGGESLITFSNWKLKR